jgi:hypothetical protein
MKRPMRPEVNATLADGKSREVSARRANRKHPADPLTPLFQVRLRNNFRRPDSWPAPAKIARPPVIPTGSKYRIWRSRFPERAGGFNPLKELF